jgi:hypothetical protein
MRPLTIQNLTAQISTLKKELKSLQNQLGQLKCFTEKGNKYVLETDFPVVIKTGLGLTFESSSSINILGPLVRFNNGNRPVAGAGDIVVMRPTGAGSPILPGTSRILID